MRKLSLLVLPLVLGATVPSSAAAPATTTYKFKGNFLYAEASDIDDCGFGNLSLTASDEVEKVNGDKTVKRRAVVSYAGYDVCEQLSWGGETEVVLDRALNLTGNTVSFAFDVNYVNPDTDERFVRRIAGSISLAANGDLEKTKERRVTVVGNTRTVVTASGNTRQANVSTQVKLDGAPLTFDGTSGVLGETKNGTVETTHY